MTVSRGPAACGYAGRFLPHSRERRENNTPAAAHASSTSPGSGTGVNVTCTRLPPTSATVGVPWNAPLTLKNGVRSVAPPGVRIGDPPVAPE